MSISILTVSGSLRAQSTNTRLLEELPSLLGPEEAVFNLYDGVETLPQFNPDKEHKINEHTEQWIELVRSSDALIVSSPEYAHGILLQSIRLLKNNG